MTVVGPLVTHPPRVLFVDDEAAMQRLVSSLLVRDGYHVVLASTAEEALVCFERARADGEAFDLVVTDLCMPGIDGEAMAVEMKRGAPLTPIVLFTGYAGERRGPPFDRVLAKPDDVRLLRATVHELAGVCAEATPASPPPSGPIEGVARRSA